MIFVSVKHTLLFFLVLFLSIPSIAQEVEPEKPDDAYAIWTDYVVRKDIGKWHVGGVFEYASIDQGEGMKHNELMARPVVGYNPLSWLRLQMHSRGRGGRKPYH